MSGINNSLAAGPSMAEEIPPWHSKYPEPRILAGSITREEVRGLLESKSEHPTHVLIDLRRNDHEGGTIRGSINLPAQSLYNSIPTLYGIFSRAHVQKIIWYCGSSRGRGTRAAGWFADFCHDAKDTEMQSLVLVGGIKGWAKAGEEFTTWMDNYEAKVWL